MSKNYGTRRIVVRAHYGLMDWLSQRVAAAIVASFTIVLLAQVLMPGAIGYSRWTGIFSAR